MRQVGVYDAKTKLTKLLDEVESGETIEITRHGKPVARLIPVARPQREAVEEAIEFFREFRKTHSLGGLKPKDLINEGRKY